MVSIEKTPQDSLENPSLPNPKRSRWPSFSQWRQLPRVLTVKEKAAVAALMLMFLGSSFFLLNRLYIAQTAIVPARGGSLVEGMVGFPRFLNPVYADANDVDRDLVQLIFSGLFRYNGKGELVADLAKDFQTDEQGKVFDVYLKENAQWHDGAPLNADDVVFTIKTIQDPAYKSPIRANWVGVDVEKVSDFTVRFRLLDPYAAFLERLTLKIIPAHIWSSVNPENFPLSPYNLQPIGSGPYQVVRVSQEKSGSIREILLQANGGASTPPLLETLTFMFFEQEEELIKQAQRGTIQSFMLTSGPTASFENPSFAGYAFSVPRYFAIFFNLEAPPDQSITKKKAVRQALQAITDKQELLRLVFENKARIVDSPFLPDIFGFEAPQEKQERNEDAALGLLKQEGYIKENGKIGKPVQAPDSLNSDLQQGSSGPEVVRLQQCLANPLVGGPEIYPEGTTNGVFGALTKQAVIRFQEKHTKEVLAPLGLTKGTGKAGQLTRELINALCFSGSKEADPLRLVLTTVDQSPLKEVAQAVQQQWEEFGIEVEVREFPAAVLERDVIKPRAYQMLLFGEILGRTPDPFPFWHSSQKKNPGLNLSSYENKQVDKLLEKVRKELDAQKRAELFEEMQNILLQDVPALFLYDFDYQYAASKEIQGIQGQVVSDPSQRFAGVEEWYIKTKRAFK